MFSYAHFGCLLSYLYSAQLLVLASATIGHSDHHYKTFLTIVEARRQLVDVSRVVIMSGGLCAIDAINPRWDPNSAGNVLAMVNAYAVA